MLSSHKSALDGTIATIARPFESIHPNVLTLFGLVPPILFVIAMNQHMMTLSIVALLLSGLDVIDGAVARKMGKVTAFGGLLDSSFDRIADSLYITAFSFAGIVRWELAIAMLVSSFMISYIRARAEGAGKGTFALNVGLIERPERILGLLVALIGTLFLPDFLLHINLIAFNCAEIIFIVLILLSVLTILQRLQKASTLLE